MKTHQFNGAYTALTKIVGGAYRLPLDAEFVFDVERLVRIMGEVHHFAVCVSDNFENVCSGAVDPFQAEDIKKRLIERLVTFCTPEV